MNVWMKKNLKKSHQKLTHVQVDPTTLYFQVHCSTIFTITLWWTYNNFFYDEVKPCPVNFLAGLLLQILKKVSYDNQQEDIYIKPRQLSYLLHSGQLIREKPTTPKCGGKEGNLGTLEFQASILPLELIWPCYLKETVEYLN